ncbi:hypothetical protein KY363_06330, partial [Candidatus Woesearchaeota archaeon]|nr:hypothetical protein [Candidatus Woesearchaeota archaeon]
MHKPPYKQMSKREAALHLDHRTADLDMYYEWRQSDEPVDVEFGGGHFISIRDMPDIRFSDMKYGQYANHVAHGRTEWEQHYEADLEDILEHDRIDRTKRREPRILVVYDEKPVRDTVQKAVMAAAPDGYSVTLVENVSGFVDSFYSG